MADLTRILQSIQQAATRAGVQVVTGDTKVVPKGAADGLFINTTGIGRLSPDFRPDPSRARPGDAVIVSGPIGSHGVAIMAAREDHPAAVAMFDLAIEIDPDFVLAHNNLGVVRAKQGRLEEASQHFRRALELEPGDPQVVEVAQLLRRSERTALVDVGPGLFTGMRVGLAAAKAIAQALRIPMIGISSLDLLSFPSRHTDRVVVPVLDRHDRLGVVGRVVVPLERLGQPLAPLVHEQRGRPVRRPQPPAMLPTYPSHRHAR